MDSYEVDDRDYCENGKGIERGEVDRVSQSNSKRKAAADQSPMYVQ